MVHGAQLKRILSHALFLTVVFLAVYGNIGICQSRELTLQNKDLRIQYWEIPSKDAPLKHIWMNTHETRGWAIDANGIMQFFNGEKWIARKRITDKPLMSLWLNESGTEGWAVGWRGVILHYKDKKWQEHRKKTEVTEKHLNAIWMKEDGMKGWVVGDDSEIRSYNHSTGEWEKFTQSDEVENAKLTYLWLNPEGTKGWAVGSNGHSLSFNGKTWKNDEKVISVDYNEITSFWMNTEETNGWAVGFGGKILNYKDNKWQEWATSGRVSRVPLISLWMKADGLKGWAVGNWGEILQYKKGEWLPHEQAGKITNKQLTSLWMNENGDIGWAVGSGGEILSYYNGQWNEYEQQEKVSDKLLTSLWMNKEGDKGWAVGSGGEILVYDCDQTQGGNPEWRRHSQAGEVTKNRINSLWMNAMGSKGWAVAEFGTILIYDNEIWRPDKEGSMETVQNLLSLWIIEDGRKGWTVSANGEIIFYDGQKWKKDNQGSTLTGEKLNFIRVNGTGTKGWAAGTGEVFLRFSLKKVDSTLTLSCETEDDLKNLRGSFRVQAAQNAFNIVSLKLITDVGSPDNSLRIDLLKEHSKSDESLRNPYTSSFRSLKAFTKRYEGVSCGLEVKANFHPSIPVEAVYLSEREIELVASPGWPWYIWVLIGIFIFFAFVYTAGFSKRVRGWIFKPVFVVEMDLKIMKIAPILFVIYNFRALRLNLFRDYRACLKKSYANIKTIDGELSFTESSSQQKSTNIYNYKEALDKVLEKQRNMLWLIEDKNRSDRKKIVLESWVKYALEKNQTPILISLDNNTSPENIVTQKSSWQGSVEVGDPNVILTLLNSGGFLVLLDIKNTVTENIQNFIMNIKGRNYVIVTTVEGIPDDLLRTTDKGTFEIIQ